MKWKTAKTDNHQGLVVEDGGEGKNIAVTYDKKDAPLVAAAPAMLDALKGVDAVVKELLTELGNKGVTNWGIVNANLLKVNAAIREAEGKD